MLRQAQHERREGNHADALDLADHPNVRRLPGRVNAPVAPRLVALLWLVALVAILAPAAVVRFGPRAARHYALDVAIPGRVIPAAELPPVEPVAFQSLDPDAARAWNAAIPFVTSANPPARPFRFPAIPDDLARATDCLAAGVYYEAGDDPPGQEAVAQVVLNRVRHPAFPKTVCGVVFQGSERTTGCQFTFACDGSLARYTPTPDQWARAHAVAVAALAGKVFRPVGYATHYHTDWVVPYWQASLDKLVAVHTQLFYRWTGWWGTPAAFNRLLQRGEPVMAALARLSEAHRPPGIGPDGLPLAPADADAALLAGAALDGQPAAVEARPGEFLLTLPPVLAPVQWPALAQHLCEDRARCTVMGWRDAAHTPATLPLEAAQVAAMSFSYLRDRATAAERTLWNCRETPRADPAQCMKQQVLGTGSPPPAQPEAAELPGVRRKAGAPAPQQPSAPPAAPFPGSSPARAGAQPRGAPGAAPAPASVP